MAKSKKLSARQVLNWWLDPKNGKIGEEYTDSYGRVKKTNSFHTVMSGFNDFIFQYYGKTGKEFIDDAVAKGLCKIRPVGKGKTGKGIPGVRVYPVSGNVDKAEQIMKEMGIS